MGKLGKVLAVFGATVLLVAGLTGCTPGLKDAQENMNNVALDTLTTSSVVLKETDEHFTDYTFAAADFVQVDDKYVIDVSGFATGEKYGKAYTNMEYVVDAGYFAEVDAQDSTQVINKVAEVVTNFEMVGFDYAPVKNLNEFNRAMGKVFESPLDGYHHSTSLTYSIDDLQFNEQEGYVTFNTRQNVKYSQTRVEMVYTIVGTDSKGNIKMGYRAQPKTYYESFNQSHQIYIKASPEEIAQMQQDKSLVFEKFIQVVNNDQKTEYTVRADNIEQGKMFEDSSDYSL